MTFRISGAALSAVAELASAMEATEFGFTAQGEVLRMTAAHTSRIAVLEATLSVEGGPTEPMAMCHDLARFKAGIKGFAKEKAVEVGVAAPDMVLGAGSRRKRISMVDSRHMETPKFPAIPFVAHGIVPLAWVRACCAESSPADSAELRLGDGRLAWKSEHDTGGFEDACEVADGDGAACGFYTPERMAEVLAPAVGDSVRISMADGLPIGFEYALPNGAAKAVLAQRM